MSTMKIRRGDEVKVVSGKEAGKTGKVMRVDSSTGRVVLERLNMVKKHTKPNPKTNSQGGVVEQEAPINVSNVMLVCPSCGQATRVGYRLLDGGGKVRICRRAECGKDIDKA